MPMVYNNKVIIFARILDSYLSSILKPFLFFFIPASVFSNVDVNILLMFFCYSSAVIFF
jgi:hypothetical protein